MRIVFLGTGAFGVPCLERLFDRPNIQIVGVVTQPDKPAGRGNQLRASPIKALALARQVPVFQPRRIRAESALRPLRNLHADVFVVIAYGQILPRTVLDLPTRACLNVHASLLPRHRGAAPIHAAIRAGDSLSGVTIMWMDEGLDTGDILLLESTPILPRDTAASLHDRLASDIAPPALDRALTLLAEDRAPRSPQNPDQATYAGLLEKQHGLVTWRLDAEETDRHIRAMTPWPGAFTHLWHNDTCRHVKILDARPVPDRSGPPGTILTVDRDGLLVACASGSLLLTQLQLEGRRPTHAADFARGARLQPGQRLGERPSHPAA